MGVTQTRAPCVRPLRLCGGGPGPVGGGPAPPLRRPGHLGEPAGQAVREAWALEQQGKREDARARYRQALAKEADLAYALFGLGRLLARRGQCDQAAAQFDRAMALDHTYGHALILQGQCYQAAGRAAKAREAFYQAVHFKRALRYLVEDSDRRRKLMLLTRVGPDGIKYKDLLHDLNADFFPLMHSDPRGWIKVINYHELRGDHPRIAALIPEIMATNPSDKVLGRIGSYYQNRSKPELARRYLTMALKLRHTRIPSMTQKNYARLQTMLAERGIRLLAVQYANRPLEPLKKLIKWRHDVLFVDNYQTFQEALARRPYEDLFIDHCYGDLGHATALGNRLLAENVAQAVLLAPGLQRPRQHRAQP